MNIHFHHILLAASAVLAQGVAAQDLSTQVNVDRTVAPEEKPATRPASLLPALTLPAATVPSLYPQTYEALSPVTRSYARLDPAAGSFAAEKSPWRGYAVLGYFPLLHGGASAGYRIADSRRLVLDASLQAEGSRNKPESRDPRKYQFYEARLGVDGAWTPDAGRLSFDLGYDFLNQQSILWEMQTVNYVDAHAKWSAMATPTVGYDAWGGASFEMPGNTIVHPEASNPSKDVHFYQPYQQDYLGGVRGSVDFAGNSTASLAVEGRLVHTGNCVYDRIGIRRGGSAGHVDLTPSYMLSHGYVNATVGLRVGLGIGDFSEKKVTVAPDINIQWAPSQKAALWLRADGGQRVMTYHDMRQYTPYQIFIAESYASNIPYRITAGMNFSPLQGLTVSAGGGYAKADRWYMLSSTVPTFSLADISGWSARVGAEYAWRFIKASAEAVFAPGDYAHAWLDNRDRARTVVNASVEATPLAPLTVGVEYRGRLDRRCYLYENKSSSLGDVCDVNAYASWRFSPRLTVFGRCENILGHRYMVAAQVVSEAQAGAVGAAFKF